MWTRQLLKENGKTAFRRNYWLCVAVSLIASLLGVSAGGVSLNLDLSSSESDAETVVHYLQEGIPPYIVTMFIVIFAIALVIGVAITMLVANIVKIGCDRYYLENREHKTEVGQLFYGFKNRRYGSNVYITFMRDLIILGYTCLLIVPGIIKAYSYSMVSYILAENPDLDRKRVLQMSSDMMNGNKMKLFVLELSFLGWNMLSAITSGLVGIFYVNPYIHATKAEFYSAVKADAIGKGLIAPEELPGVGYQEQTVEW